MSERDRQTRTSSFGVGRREGHDSSSFYQRFSPPQISNDETVNRPADLIETLRSGKLFHGSIDQLQVLPENSVALVVTSPPYFVGKEYELAVTGEGPGKNGSGNTGEAGDTARIPETYFDFLDMLRRVFAECYRVLEPGGRIAVNVANLGRKPYRSLSADIISLLQDDLGMLLRGEVIWEKASVSSGSCAWGSFAKASNPVLRDMTERVIIASKGRFSRALTLKKRRELGLPHESSLANDEFVDVTRDVWRIDPESATRIGHPAPFPVELPRRLIDLYTYRGDLVVDPFVGSGTTLVAAARTGRIGIGFDTDQEYLNLSEQRLNDELAKVTERGDIFGGVEDPASIGETEVDGLSFDDRTEYFQARAVAEGKKVQDIARRILEEAGFVQIKEKPKYPGGVIDFNLVAVHPSDGSRWWIEIPGSFTTNRPGLQRIDAVWRLLGRLSVVGSPAATSATNSTNNGASSPDRVLVLTASLPKPGSPADKALRAAGPGIMFDAVELYDPAGAARLAAYAGSDNPEPAPGFWTSKQLDGSVS